MPRYGGGLGTAMPTAVHIDQMSYVEFPENDPDLIMYPGDMIEILGPHYIE